MRKGLEHAVSFDEAPYGASQAFQISELGPEPEVAAERASISELPISEVPCESNMETAGTSHSETACSQKALRLLVLLAIAALHSTVACCRTSSKVFKCQEAQAICSPFDAVGQVASQSAWSPDPSVLATLEGAERGSSSSISRASSTSVTSRDRALSLNATGNGSTIGSHEEKVLSLEIGVRLTPFSRRASGVVKFT